MSDEDDRCGASVNQMPTEHVLTPQPSSLQLAAYIAEMATEFARIAETAHMPVELIYVLKMAAVSAAKFAGDTVDSRNIHVKSYS